MKLAGFLLITILFFVILTRTLYRRAIVSETIAGKILHIVAISISATAPYFISNNTLLLVVGVVVPILYLLVNYGFFMDVDQGRKSWGMVYFAVVFLILLLLFPKNPELIFFPLLVLALADGFATIIGSLFGNHTYSFGAETKSWEGSIAFLIFSIISLQIIPLFLPFAVPPFTTLYSLIIASVFLTVLEALSIKGRDNIWVPLAVAYWVLLDTGFIHFISLLLVMAVIAIVIYTYKKRWLSSGGALATFLLGCLLLVSPQPKWIVPALFFFIVGSLISFLPKLKREPSHSGRTANQVFYNGGISTVFICAYFLTDQVVFLIGGLSALSASMSDTSSSEIGSRYGRKTFNILTGKRVEAGLSGGISMAGLGAGFAFTVIFCLVCVGLMESFSWKYLFILFLSGMAGNLSDSILGAAFQVKYRPNSNSQWSDFPTDSPEQEVKGYRFITNDMVNLLTTIFAAVVGVVLYFAMY